MIPVQMQFEPTHLRLTYDQVYTCVIPRDILDQATTSEGRFRIISDASWELFQASLTLEEN